MTLKGSDIFNKLIAAGMVLASIGFFSDIGHTTEFIIPGLLFGAGGFFLALRRDRQSTAELELHQRVEQLAEDLAATRAELGTAQERLDRLGEERDFMRQLVPSPVLPPAPVVVPPNPVAAQLPAHAPDASGSASR